MGELTTGQRIAELRRQRGLSQRELAQEVNRSESWVSQVERDIQPLERLSTLQALADALGASVRELRPDVRPADETPAPIANDLDTLRVTLAGHPALRAIDAPRRVPNIDRLRRQVDQAWTYTHESRFAELSRLLERLLPELEDAVRRHDEAQGDELHQLLARTYQAAAAAFSRQDEPDAAWLASDRAITAAERSSDPLEAVAGAFRMAHAFIRLGRFDQAEHVATLAIDALHDQATVDRPRPEVLSLYGAMHLVRAIIHGREGQRSAAHRQVQAARRIAKQLGDDRNDYATEFGPTNTELHAVSVAVDLGDAGEALELAEKVDPSVLSVDRHARFLLDTARAHAQRRHVGDATSALLYAESLAPEQVRSHYLMRETVRDLLQLTGRRASDELHQLAERTGVTA